MRIFLSCQQALKRHDVPAYGFWETYLKKGIEEAGHEWIEAKEVDWAEGLTHLSQPARKEWRDRTWNRVVDSIKQQHRIQPIDLFLPEQVESKAVQEIQALDIPCVNFFCDNVREFNEVPQAFHCFDLNWVPEFKALSMYQQAKLNHVYAPMPVWIPPEQRTWTHAECYGVSFIGSRDVQRELLLAQAIEAGAAIEIRGAAWNQTEIGLSNSKTSHQSAWQTCINQWQFLTQKGLFPWIRKLQSKSIPQVQDDVFASFIKPQPDATEYAEIIQQSIVTLGINRYPSFRYPFLHPDTYSRMRDIEAPMMGACYLTEWTEGLDHLYVLGEEIETYRTAEEMVEKIQQLKASPEKRKQMRMQGQNRVLSDHTITKSLEKIIHLLNL
jgi:Glycosyl transferases group 1